MKKTIVTGLKPSGKLHIGHYLGLLQSLPGIIKEYSAYIFIADLHSLTELREEYSAKGKKQEIFEMVVDAFSLGISPKKCVFFTQSDVSEHSELMWIFNCITPVSFLERMTQYKDKSAKNVKNINMGLMDYPVLQAADILLYDADIVPVGIDQVQHVELSRDIARFFNNKFGKTFKEPAPKLTNIPKVMSLTNPDKKMSKSDGEKSCIFLSDEPDVILEKLKKATTDKAGLENLYGLGDIFIKGFKTSNYINENLKLKTALAKAIADHFAKFRAERKKWLKNEKKIDKILAEGAVKARKIASKKMKEVRKKVGLK